MGGSSLLHPPAAAGLLQLFEEVTTDTRSYLREACVSVQEQHMPSDLWIVFALLSAFFHAARLSVTKYLSFDYSAQALTLYVNLASLVVTVPLIVWNHQFPVQDPRYLTAVLVGGLVSGLGAWSLNHAI